MSEEVVEDASGHTTTPMSGRKAGRIEVIARVSGRRDWTVEQKLMILRDAFGPGGSVRAAIERHDVTSGLIYTWRRKAMSGQLTGPKPSMPAFAEVRLTEPPVSLPPPALVEGAGKIMIELPTGVRVSVDAAVDGDALARVLGALGQ